MKKTRSEEITDTVWFKHKYITQPCVTSADQIVKAINNLTWALKGKNNVEGLEQMEAIQKLKELLTKAPIQEEEPAQVEPEPRVTFEPSVKPPAPTPRVEITKPEGVRIQMNKKRMSFRDATIQKPIQKASNKRTTRVPLARVLARNQQLTLNRTPTHPQQRDRQISELLTTSERSKACKTVGTLSSKHVWTTGTGSWHQDQRHQHNPLH